MAHNLGRPVVRTKPHLDWRGEEPIRQFERRQPQRNGGHRGRGRSLLFLVSFFAFLLGLFYLGRTVGDRLFAPSQMPAVAALVTPLHSVQSISPALPPLVAGELSYRVKKGDTWASIMSGFGFASSDAVAVVEAVKDLSSRTPLSDQLAVGQEISFDLTNSLGIAEIVTLKGQDKKLVIRKASEGQFVASLRALPKLQKERVLLGLITKEDNSFSAAARRAGVTYEIVDDLVDLFSDKIRFRQDFQVGDRFTVVYNEEIVGESSSSVGAILAARVDVNGSRFIAIRYVGNDGKARYFDAEGKPLGGSFLRYPLKFSRISSEFSSSRFHPVLKRARAHNGVDFAAPTGTPVRTVANGAVVFAGRKGGNGLMVSIKHSDRYQTVYCHLSKIDSKVRRGATVSRGQIIGAVGATGLATGPHLHFGFFDNGKYVDPLKIKLPTDEAVGRGTRIGDGYLQRVLFTLERYQAFELENLHPTDEL